MSSPKSQPPEVQAIEAEDLLSIRTIGDAQISPDGSRIAYTVTEIDAEKDEYRTSIWVVPTRGGEPVQFTRGPKRDTASRWSPDGARLAFLSDREGKPAQLYVMAANGGEARKLTSLEHGAGPARWSPDGMRLLFAARVPTEQPPSDMAARERWDQRPRVVTKAHYKYDGTGYLFDTRGHLFVVPVKGGEATQITDGDCDDRTPAWSPDGMFLVFSRTRSGAADFALFDIWVAAADGGNPRQVTANVGRASSPSWSPDGATIACYGTDEQQAGLGEPLFRVWTIPAAGGAARRLTAEYDRGAFLLPPPAVNPGPVWSADSETLTFPAADAGNVQLVRAAVADGKVRPVVRGERQAWVMSVAAASGRIAFVATQPDDPGDVYSCAWDGSDEQRLTRANSGVLARLTMPQIERRAFTSPNGGMIEGWLVRPMPRVAGGARRLEAEASRRAEGPVPLLVHIHGGPHAFVGNAFPHSAFYWYVLASRGWAVLALNSSGSGSYGQAFAHSLRGRWGEYDLPEQLAAIEALVAEGIADPDRLAVAGYSYGGYMTSWIITQTDRFKAAVVGGPVTNLESFHGTSDIGMWFGPWEMKGDIVTARETYRRLSPVNYVDRVTTPTLILHGEADDRCPIGQGEELYVGLVAVGKAPAEFVRYPAASHLFCGTGRPSHRVDYNRRVVEWLERYALP